MKTPKTRLLARHWHYPRLALMPSVTIGRYALAAGYDMWRVALALCDEAMLDAAVLAMGIVPQEEN